MKKIFILLLLGFLFYSSFADELRCDNEEALTKLKSQIIKEIYNEFAGGPRGSFVGAPEKRGEYVNDFSHYLENDVKIEFSSFKTKDIKTARISHRKVYLCIAKVSITFPEPPNSTRLVQEERASKNLVRELSVRLDIAQNDSFRTSFNGDTHEMDNVAYQISQGNNPELIVQPIIARFGHYIDSYE